MDPLTKVIHRRVVSTWVRLGYLYQWLAHVLICRLGLGPAKRTFRNIEGHTDYDVTLPRSVARPGIAAVIRVKNEQSKIAACLSSIYPFFDELIILDNASDDGTKAILEDFGARHDPENKIRIFDYPFQIARNGPENRQTPEMSVKSSAYYYNYAIAQATCRHVAKWDADMVVPADACDAFRKLLDDIRAHDLRAVELFGRGLYRAPDGSFYMHHREVHHETRFAHLSYIQRFRKEMRSQRWAVGKACVLSRTPLYYELKFTEEAEFDHWSDLSEAMRRPRKKREVENFEAIKSGNISSDFTRLRALSLEELIGAQGQPGIHESSA